MARILDFFKRPAFSLAAHDIPESDTAVEPSDEAGKQPQYSPLSDPPSSLSSTRLSPDYQKKSSLLSPVKGSTKDAPLEPSLQSNGTGTEPAQVGSFCASQRVTRDGKEVVISSDGEDTDSIRSLEDPDNLFMNNSASSNDDVGHNENDQDGTSAVKGMELRSRRVKGKDNTNELLLQNASAPKYKFTLDSLVTNAIDDREVEANVAQLRTTFQATASSMGREPGLFGVAPTTTAGRTELPKHILISALDGDSEGMELQRLYEAVHRTEAFDQEKRWSFFDKNARLLLPPEFPRDSIVPGTYLSVLRSKFLSYNT